VQLLRVAFTVRRLLHDTDFKYFFDFVVVGDQPVGGMHTSNRSTNNSYQYDDRQRTNHMDEHVCVGEHIFIANLCVPMYYIVKLKRGT